jgi:hypoxanthine phosphoribosyltransferase
MRVVDCVDATFALQCRTLAKRAAADYSPDLLVAIERGGLHVAREILSGGVLAADLVAVTAQRPTTAVKRRWNLRATLSRLPRPIANWVRLLEHYVRLATIGRTSARVPEVTASPQVRERIAASRRLLVVDDAVDSGATMAAVIRELRTMTDAEIRSAVLAVTFPAPAVTPEYAVHRSGVLLRLPWSDDAGSAT